MQRLVLDQALLDSLFHLAMDASCADDTSQETLVAPGDHELAGSARSVDDHALRHEVAFFVFREKVPLLTRQAVRARSAFSVELDRVEAHDG